MNRSITMAAVVACALGSVAHAAVSVPPAQIVVVGVGSVTTSPDVAAISYTVRGEGVTARLAVADLTAKRAAIEAVVAAIAPPKVTLSAGDLKITEVRNKVCRADDDAPSLSTGDCRVQGYVAALDTSVRISPIDDAGRVVSAAAQRGASDVKIERYTLAAMDAARRRSVAAALADAHAAAAEIAVGSGMHVGPLISVRDERSEPFVSSADIIVTAERRPGAPRDVEIAPFVLNPEPVEVTTRLVVTYSVTP